VTIKDRPAPGGSHEGIENEDEKHWIEEHRTHFLQGYLFACPGTPPQI
jgi:EAL domain-containing protein (putative c-di-GMP-specific phosphodiesterase class I)